MTATDFMQPLVSIIITSYNRAIFIERAIESALDQDYDNIEVIISDNKSTDDTNEIIKKYIHDSRVKYFVNESNIGMIPNFQLATERAQGEFITYVSSDDYLINNSFISEAVKIINTYKDILLIFSRNKTLIEKTNTLIEYDTHHLYAKEFENGKDAFINFSNTKALGWGGTLIHRQTLLDLHVFESRATSLDYEANLLMMLKGNIGFIKEPTYVVRIHDNQASQQNSANDVIKNFSFIINPYRFAKYKNAFSSDTMEKWKNDLLFLDSKSATMQLLAINKTEYHLLMDHLKKNYPVVYKRLKKDLRWNIFYLLYSRPKLSLKFIGLFSKGHYRNLKALVAIRQ